MLFRRRATAETPSREYQSEGKILHSGYLQKRGQVNRSLKQRWFVLLDRKLYYAKGPDQKPIDCIPLDQAVIRPAVEDTSDFAFEIVISARVYFIVAASQQDMLEWIKLLSQQTRLNKENHFIEQAEDMISKATYLQARSDEEKEHEQVKEEMKTRKIVGLGIGRNPSSPNLHTAHPPPSMPTSSLPPSSLPAGHFIPLPAGEGQPGLYSSESSLRVFRRV